MSSEFAAWGVFSQAFGAAVSYPLYCLVEVQRHDKYNRSKSTHDHSERLTFVFTSILVVLMPAWLLYPAFRSCSGATRQILIASYRASPIVLAFIEPTISNSNRRRSGNDTRSGTNAWLKTSLRISAAFATAFHIYVILDSQQRGHGALAAVFWPGSTLKDSTRRDFLAQACHLFLQNDLIIIVLALVPYSVFLHGDGLEHRRWSGWLRKTLSLALLSVVASPGAAFTWTLAGVL